MSMTAKEIAAALANCADRVAAYLLPNGKKSSGEWCVGSVSGEAGESLKVRISGSKTGVWMDFATSQSGDLLDLWATVRGLDISGALKEAKAWLGVRDVALRATEAKTYRKPKRPDGTIKPLPQTIQWLAEVRKIGAEAVSAYKVAQVAHGQLGNCLVFPFFVEGELTAIKYRKITGKEFTQEAGCEPCLFGWQAIPPTAREVTIVEGELDALAAWQYGFPALSVPTGGGGGNKQQWIAHEFDRLARFDRIYLCLDSDKPGIEATAEIIKRLGQDRCLVVTLPEGCKDANDCAMQGVERSDFADCFKAARSIDPPELRDVSEFADDVERVICGQDIGIPLPWKKCGQSLLIRPGETVVLAGINGHGKSQLAGWLLLNAIRWHDVTACVASLEFKTAKWLARMVRQATARHDPSSAQIRHVMHKLSGAMYSFDLQSGVNYRRMIDVFKYARNRYGCTYFLVDNLAKCGIPEDDYRAQHEFMQVLTNFNRDNETTTLLVHHMRKGDNEDANPGKMSVKGSGSITDLADTVLSIWRNKKKEQKVKAALASNMPISEDVRREEDAVLTCSKQRNGNDEPIVRLWFDRTSFQYLANEDHVPRPLYGLSSVREYSDER